MEKLVKITEHFKEVEWFTIEEVEENGIGPAGSVQSFW
jgi:hypothetical protein